MVRSCERSVRPGRFIKHRASHPTHMVGLAIAPTREPRLGMYRGLAAPDFSPGMHLGNLRPGLSHLRLSKLEDIFNAGSGSEEAKRQLHALSVRSQTLGIVCSCQSSCVRGCREKIKLTLVRHLTSRATAAGRRSRPARTTTLGVLRHACATSGLSSCFRGGGHERAASSAASAAFGHLVDGNIM